MKTISPSSLHCSVFRCQASGTHDLLLKNNYEICHSEMTATPLLGIYTNVFLNDSEPEILAASVLFIYFQQDRSVSGWHRRFTGISTRCNFAIQFQMASMQSKWDSNFIISIGEQLDRSLRKWHLLWVIEFFLQESPGQHWKDLSNETKQDY